MSEFLFNYGEYKDNTFFLSPEPSVEKVYT